MEIIRKTVPTDGDIKKAIELRTSECFGAMNIVNALAGIETDAWYLVRHYTLAELKAEAEKRGIVFKEVSTHE